MGIQVVVLGDSGVGKSSLIQRLQGLAPVPAPKPTLVMDFRTLDLDLKTGSAKVQIIDCSGSAKHAPSVRPMLAKSHCALVVYDVRRPPTLNSAVDWIINYRRLAGSNASVLLVGNKTDFVDADASTEARLSTETGMDAAKRLGCLFCEASAIQESSIHDQFRGMVEDAVDRLGMIPLVVQDLSETDADNDSFGHIAASQAGLYSYIMPMIRDLIPPNPEPRDIDIPPEPSGSDPETSKDNPTKDDQASSSPSAIQTITNFWRGNNVSKPPEVPRKSVEDEKPLAPTSSGSVPPTERIQIQSIIYAPVEHYFKAVDSVANALERMFPHDNNAPIPCDLEGNTNNVPPATNDNSSIQNGNSKTITQPLSQKDIQFINDCIRASKPTDPLPQRSASLQPSSVSTSAPIPSYL